MIRELPRVLTIYDIDMPIKDATAAVERHFRKNAYLRDQRYCHIISVVYICIYICVVYVFTPLQSDWHPFG